MAPRNSAKNTRGRPFAPGNPGKPRGARHKAAVAAEALLDGEAEALTRKAVEMALAGDTLALRLCLERIAPPRKDRPIAFAVESLSGPADALEAAARAIEAVSAGEITPSEATVLMSLFEGYRRMFETTEVEGRLAAPEQAAAR